MANLVMTANTNLMRCYCIITRCVRIIRVGIFLWSGTCLTLLCSWVCVSSMLSVSHFKYLESALNDICPIITECLKPTNNNYLYLLTGIVPPNIRRQVISRRERYKVMHDLNCCMDPRQRSN